MSVGVVLTAAGSGSRLGSELPKALVLLGGQPLVARAAQALVEALGDDLAALVVTAPAGASAAVTEAVRGAVGSGPVVVLVEGGVSRQASVAAGLAALAASPAGRDVDVVLVHDAARPLVPAAVVRRVLAAVRSGHPAVVPALPVTDTIKRVEPGAGPVEPVLATVPRAALRAVQTPQGFDRALLERAHRSAAGLAGDEALAASDDAGLVELLGEPVGVVPGDDLAAKITTRRDLLLAGLLLQEDGR